MSQRVWAAASVAMKGRTAAAVSFFEFMERSLKGRTAAVCQTRGEGVNRAADRIDPFHGAASQLCAATVNSNSKMSLSGGWSGFGLTLIGARPSIIFACAWAIESVMRDRLGCRRTAV